MMGFLVFVCRSPRPTIRSFVTRAVPVFLALSVSEAAGQSDDWRTIEFETTQVTTPDIALSPDGEHLVFTMLGHLFRLRVEGGAAEQLTFGPYYDAEPAFSPDGSRIAFQSDRDGGEGNIFVLELATGKIIQVSREIRTIQHAWTPDGEALVYLVRQQPLVGGSPAEIRRVALAGGEPGIVVPPGFIRGAFYLPDGRLAWSAMEPVAESPRVTTRIEVMSPEGRVSTLRRVPGYLHRVVASPGGDGLYCSQYLLTDGTEDQPKSLVFVPLPEGEVRHITSLSGWHFSPRFEASADGRYLYFGDGGRLWKISLSEGEHELLPFSAKVTLEVREPVAPPKAALTARGPFRLRGVEYPTLSPDGRAVVFVAAGQLWQQSLDGGVAQQLIEADGFVCCPRFSPDGSRLALDQLPWGRLQVLNLETGQTRTVVASRARNASWSPDGRRLVYRTTWDREVIVVNVADGMRDTVAKTWWFPHPSFSADGKSVYYTTAVDGVGTLVRMSLEEGGEPEPTTKLERHLDLGYVSPNERWLAFRRNREIWVAPLGDGLVTEDKVRQLTRDGGKTFTFAPDGSAVIYAAGDRVWRHPLAGGERVEIPIRLELRRATAQPLLVRRVRILDFASAGFSSEMSLLIEQGRIRWIGEERDHEVPEGAWVLNAEGRFAIPGLFDMHYDWCTYNEVFVAYGITSVRCPDDWGTALVDRGDVSGDPVPRAFFSGKLFEGAVSFGANDYLQIYDEDQARSHVRLWKERGSQFIKAYSSLPWHLLRAVAEETRRLDLPVAGHGMSLEEITKSVTLGYHSLEHFRPEERWYGDVLQMFASAGTRWDPTLTGMDVGDYLLGDERERLLDEKLRSFVGDEAFRRLEGSLVHRRSRGRSAEILASVREAHEMGVNLLAGTGVVTTLGPSLHWELELFAEAGLPALDIIRIATLEAATAVGAEEDLGTLESGKLGDVVLLDASPLEDIANTQRIWRVIKGGWVFDPEELRPERN